MRNHIVILIAVFISLSICGNAQEVIAGGVCSNGLRWEAYMEDNVITLTLQGNGAMEESPWRKNDIVDLELIQNVVIEEGITSICKEAFDNCSNMKSIVMPNTITRIEGWAFNNCQNLQSIQLPKSLTYIGPYAFSLCSSLETIDIPNSVTRIGYQAFRKCEKLSSVTLSDSITELENGIFNACSSLKSIVIPPKVTRIRDICFSKCTSLTSIDIPEGVTSIGIYTFRDCTNLTSITIPRSMESIGATAFHNCIKLQFLYVNHPYPIDLVFYGKSEYDDGMWSNVNTDSCTIYVPKGWSSVYKRDEDWGVFKNINEYDAEPFEPYLTICYGDSVLVAQKVRDSYSQKLLIPNKYKRVWFNDEDVTSQIVDGTYVTPPITKDSTLSIDIEYDRRDNNGDGVVDSQDVLNVYECIRRN